MNPQRAKKLGLADGDLTLPEIFDLHLERPRLAVLSACETGVPGLELPDEVESLPGGMMQAGIPGVVGSLWSVNDLSTAMLITLFYDFWREKQLPAPEALRQAQIWLRDLAQDEEKLTALETTAAGVRLSADQADALYKLGTLRDFSHPFYWAAFTYTGI
jgi:CHAT domain-containing protein